MVMCISSCCGFFFTTPSRETPASSRTQASMAALVRSGVGGAAGRGSGRWASVPRTYAWPTCIRVLELGDGGLGLPFL